MTPTDRFLASCRADARETIQSLIGDLNALHGTVNFSGHQLTLLAASIYQAADHLADLALEMHEGPDASSSSSSRPHEAP